jgi:predicted anti-sigma-YlaC factor YlaD
MTVGREMTCKELVELVTDYLEGALPESDRVRFDEHLVGCPFCRTYLDQMRQTIRAAGQLREEAMAPEALAELVARFNKWR